MSAVKCRLHAEDMPKGMYLLGLVVGAVLTAVNDKAVAEAYSSLTCLMLSENPIEVEGWTRAPESVKKDLVLFLRTFPIVFTDQERICIDLIEEISRVWVGPGDPNR